MKPKAVYKSNHHKTSSDKKVVSNSVVDESTSKLLEKYFDKNRKRKISKIRKVFSVENIDSDDEEVFIMQCSKSISIKSLLNQQIALSTTSTVDDKRTLEMVTQRAEHNHQITLICGGNNPKPITFEAAGVINVRKHIKVKYPKSESSILKQYEISGPVPFPKNLKVRHPFLGADYAEKLQLPATVLQQLKKAKKKTSKVDNSQKDDMEMMIDDGDRESRKSKKLRKRKLDQSFSPEKIALEAVIENEPKKKKIKSEKSTKEKKSSNETDITNDLEWLTQI